MPIDFSSEPWASDPWRKISFDDYIDEALEDGTPLYGRAEIEIQGMLFHYGVTEEEAAD